MNNTYNRQAAYRSGAVLKLLPLLFAVLLMTALTFLSSL